MLVLLAILVIVSFKSNAGPWTDTSKMDFHAIGQDDENGMPVYWMDLYPNISKEYENRFGAFPNLVLWKDNPEPREAIFGVTYYISREEYEEHQPWIRPLKFKNVKDYIYWKLENIKTGLTVYYPSTTTHEEDVIDREDYYTIGWATLETIDAWTLDLDDNTAYNISLEIWEGVPTNGKFIAGSEESIVIVKTNHEKPLDDYMDKTRKNKLAGDPDFMVSHLMIYPFHDYVLSKLSSFYTRQENCDSLKWVTAQWLYTLENQLDPFYAELTIAGRIRTGPRGLSPKLRESIMGGIQDVCGDTLLPPPWRTE